jgi:integrase
MVLFLDDTAARAAGVVGLVLADLNVAKRYAWVHEKGLGGNRKERKVFFSPETAAALARWLAQRPAGEAEQVFVSAAGRPLAVKGLYEALRRAARRAGVAKDWSPHKWRHGTLRRMKQKGINLGLISQLAGHSTVQLTGDLYGLLDEDELQAAVDGVLWDLPQPPATH